MQPARFHVTASECSPCSISCHCDRLQSARFSRSLSRLTMQHSNPALVAKRLAIQRRCLCSVTFVIVEHLSAPSHPPLFEGFPRFAAISAVQSAIDSMNHELCREDESCMRSVPLPNSINIWSHQANLRPLTLPPPSPLRSTVQQ